MMNKMLTVKMEDRSFSSFALFLIFLFIFPTVTMRFIENKFIVL